MKRRQFAAQAAAAAATASRAVGFRAGPHGAHPGRLSAGRLGRRHRALLAEKMRVSLGQNVIVDNKPGAAGRSRWASSSARRPTARRWCSRPAARW
jgi:hypothetical protein